jgi:hypothetical protein
LNKPVLLDRKDGDNYLFSGGFMKNEITIFHLQRKDGTPLLLHPFDDPALFLKLDADTVISGRYGKEPRPESVTMLRNELYRKAETAVKSWITEKRFIPRFLASSALFMLLYFFFSLVVRDPLPMIDEIAISLGGAVFLYFALSRRASGSKEAASKRIMLRERIDSILFIHDPVLEEAEKLLSRLEVQSPRELADQLAEGVGAGMEGDREAIDQLVEYLSRLFTSRAYRRQERALKKSPESERMVLDTKLDLPLYGLYRILKGKSGTTRRY